MKFDILVCRAHATRMMRMSKYHTRQQTPNLDTNHVLPKSRMSHSVRVVNACSDVYISDLINSSQSRIRRVSHDGGGEVRR